MSRLQTFTASALLTLLASNAAMADDTEIYQSQAATLGTQPNVLFIIDTSGSMDTEVQTVPAYDPTKTYTGACAANRIYFSTNDTIPECSTESWFPAASNTCDATRQALGNTGGGSWPALGGPRERLGQFRRDGMSGTQWRALGDGDAGKVECRADDARHGESAGSVDRFIVNNGDGWGGYDSGLWNANPLNAQTYRLYSGNFLNYQNGPRTPVTMTRLEIVRDVAVDLAGSLQNVNLGLMRYSSDAQGGMVIQAVDDIADNRANIIGTLRGFTPTSGDGFTPLSETLYEAALYYRGDAIDYGLRSSPIQSVDAAKDPTNNSRYNSPIDSQCQKNYIVYLTDGLPTRDHDANDKAGRLIGSACDDPDAPSSSGWEPTDGRCADDLAGYLNTRDLSPLPKDQTVSTYMIGFGKDVAASAGFLDDVAFAGGTDRAYTASDRATLTDALQKIFAGIAGKGATFTTPSITLNAFNRSQTSNELYFALFKPDQTTHWPGNLKKYAMDGTRVIDALGASAVDGDGFFAELTTSYWSTVRDGGEVTIGGAVGKLSEPAARKLYTALSGPGPIVTTANLFDTSNDAITDLRVGAGSSAGDCSELCEKTINWVRGVDVNDVDGDNNRTETVRFIGDPLHGRIGVVSYGGAPGAMDAADTVIYVPTNDGFLHAFNGKTGEELWAFIPPELLSRLFLLQDPSATASRSYGLDGDIRVLKLDKNQDGVIDSAAGDSVRLYFGMRAGGNHYYGIDVTNRAQPELLWNIGPDQLPGVGQTWSPPAITRVRVDTNGNDDPEKFVLIFGGGYDTTQETQAYADDNVGNRIFIVDADSGRRLWFAGGPSASATAGVPDLALPQMTSSIPAALTVIDTNGDQFADRLYAGDMGGRVWRFDIQNGKPTRQLVAGGVLATLGAGSVQPRPSNRSARRFYNAPDVSLIQQRGREGYYNIAIGSGYRGHPLDTSTDETFYAIRDRQPYAQLSQNAYNSLPPILDSELVDITNLSGATVPAGFAGWKLRLTAQSGRAGEKVLAEATTAGNTILFTTFQPSPAQRGGDCFPANQNRAYAVSAITGKAALDFNGDGDVTDADLSTPLNQKGIVGEVNIGLVRDPAQQDPDTPPGTPRTVCVAGVEILRKCVDVGGTVRTFWQRPNGP